MAIFSDNDENQNTPAKEKNVTAKTKDAGDRRNLKTEETAFDSSFESNIRPQKLDEYIGQSALKGTLKISIEASKKRNTQIDHMLFYGPPGLGKTTLASVIANELETNIKITSAPALEKPRDIIGILMSLKQGEILFIDEIHRLNKVTEEILYPAMEDFFLDMTTGKAQTVKTLRVPLPRFTLIGATTKAGAISGPLRDRFGIIHRLQFYTKDELAQVVTRTAKILGIELDEEGAYAIAESSRGTPRIANRLVRRVADYAIVKANGKITKNVADAALKALHIAKSGLDNNDMEILKLIIEKFNGGPVGIETIAAALGEDTKTIEDVYEPFLLQEGYLQRTPRGRKVSPECYKIMGYAQPEINEQQSLF